MKTPIEKRIKHLIRSVNRLRIVGKYNLSKETDTRIEIKEKRYEAD